MKTPIQTGSSGQVPVPPEKRFLINPFWSPHMPSAFKTLLVLACSSTLAMAVEPASLFQDGMVLQRDVAVPVWGGGQPGETVTVRFKGQSKTATADAAGRWRVTLDALAVDATPQELVIAGTATVTVKDVLVGDVWLCSGQSNMEFSMKRTVKPDQLAAMKSSAKDALLRLFTVEHVAAKEPKLRVPGTWSPCAPASAMMFSYTGYHFGSALRKHLNIPIGLVCAAWGGTTCEAWTSMDALKTDPAWPILEGNWSKKLAKPTDGNEPAAAAQPNDQAADTPPRYPGNLYHGMIHPLIPFAFRGVIWYQGESNAHGIAESSTYHTLFPTLIKDWRTRFGYEIPFLFVQLANWKDVQTEPVEMAAGWPVVREAQLQTLALPRTGMVVAIDVGDEPKNIHPRNKKLVGERLALAARKVVYGEDVVASGPIFTGLKTEGASLRLSFDHAAGLKADGGILKGFAVRGASGPWSWADARIDGTTVVVSSATVPAPKSVRYSWAMNPIGNLRNGADLPASPFRSDH